MVVGGRGVSQRCQPDVRRSHFDPCTPGWFRVGRLACGLFTLKWRLQLRCGRCAVVLAASWSPWSVWVSLRCCRWSYHRILFVQPARPCRRWSVASWLVQVRRSAVCQRWLAVFVMVELRCSVLLVGRVVSGRGSPRCRHPVGRGSRLDPFRPGWFGVGRLACRLFTVMWRLQLWCGWCAVVAAASWSAGFMWVPSRCFRWSYRPHDPQNTAEYGARQAGRHEHEHRTTELERHPAAPMGSTGARQGGPTGPCHRRGVYI